MVESMTKQAETRAERKLKEFYRWLAITGRVKANYTDNWFLVVPGLKNGYSKFSATDWRYRAPEEVE